MEKTAIPTWRRILRIIGENTSSATKSTKHISQREKKEHTAGNHFCDILVFYYLSNMTLTFQFNKSGFHNCNECSFKISSFDPRLKGSGSIWYQNSNCLFRISELRVRQSVSTATKLSWITFERLKQFKIET